MSGSPLTRVRRSYWAGDVEDVVRVLRESPDMRARRSAAEYLGRMGDRRALKPLLRSLEVSDLLLKNLAVKALALLGDPAAAPALFELAASAASPGVRVTAMSALGDLGDRRSVGLIVELLLDDELAQWMQQPDGLPQTSIRRRRRWAARRLVELDAKEVVPALEAALPGVELRKRRQLRRLIRKLNG